MRKATTEEIIDAAYSIIARMDWQETIDFARAVYGERVYRAELVLDASDEGTVFLVGVRAYDSEGEAIDYNFTLPFWQQYYQGEVTYLRAISMLYQDEMTKRKGTQVTPELHAEVWKNILNMVLFDALPDLNALDKSDFFIDEPPAQEPLVLYVAES